MFNYFLIPSLIVIFIPLGAMASVPNHTPADELNLPEEVLYPEETPVDQTIEPAPIEETNRMEDAIPDPSEDWTESE